MYKFLDFFKDKQGRIVLFQMPNWPLILWFIFAVLDFLWSSNQPKIHYLLQMLSFGFIFTWAWLEITSGVNYFRRTLGLLVLIIAVYSQYYNWNSLQEGTKFSITSL
ncbi:hypothetical protein ACQUW5_13965 [Legionella sp. CNM-1927-20]|uniref:hypothetical protein n=1 Tax=Legionella sp. CNM-1927-20 TaxID=3422221 RepID=UPI00403B2769